MKLGRRVGDILFGFDFRSVHLYFYEEIKFSYGDEVAYEEINWILTKTLKGLVKYEEQLC